MTLRAICHIPGAFCDPTRTAAEPPAAAVEVPNSRVEVAIESRARIRSRVGEKTKSETVCIEERTYLVDMLRRPM